MARTVRIGWGSAYAGDNLELAGDLAAHAELDYLCFDALAERTLALAQVRRQRDPAAGYDLRLTQFGRQFLPYADRGLCLITNMGGANPGQAARLLAQEAQALGLRHVRVAAVAGDDVYATVRDLDPVMSETAEPLSQLDGRMVSANAYIGAEAVAAALSAGANVVIGGRIADPSLALAALQHAFHWPWDDWLRLGRGIVAGHLLECGTHLTGGNFADPPYRVVPGLDNLGMPWADLTEDGEIRLAKLDSSGGLLSEETVKAQLVYEIHDPARYFTPDVTADFRDVTVRQDGLAVRVTGGSGAPRPDQLKVLVGVDEGFYAEAEVSYAGPGAVDRARLSQEVVVHRLRALGVDDLRCDLIGLNAIHGPASETPITSPYEVRLRVAAHTCSEALAHRLTREVEWQYFGPAGAGGMRGRVVPQLSLYSTFIERGLVPTHYEMMP